MGVMMILMYPNLIYSGGADGVHVVFSGGTGNSNPDGCDHADKFIIPYVNAIPERATAMLSGISMAYASKNTISVLLIGCMAGIGGTTYPKIHYLYLK